MSEENKTNVKQTTTDPVVLEMEAKYPEMTKEFKRLMKSQYELFCKKMNNYGKGNIMLGGDINNEFDRKIAISGVVIRLNDKSNRLINLTLKGTTDSVNEPIIDAFIDMCNYSIIAQILHNEKWK